MSITVKIETEKPLPFDEPGLATVRGLVALAEATNKYGEAVKGAACAVAETVAERTRTADGSTHHGLVCQSIRESFLAIEKEIVASVDRIVAEQRAQASKKLASASSDARGAEGEGYQEVLDSVMVHLRVV